MLALERLVECWRWLRQDWELERHVVSEHAAWHAAGIASDGSRRMVGARHNINWVQGYNAQAVVGEGQIVLAAEISSESLDTANLQPMVETALDELARAGVAARPGVVLADAGSGKTTHRNAVRRRHPTLVAPDADRRKEPRRAARRPL